MPKRLEAVGVGVDFVAFDGAAAAGNVDDARHPAELALQHPVLHRLEIVERVQVVAGRVAGAVERVAEDFAGGRLGRKLRRDAGRQRLGELKPIDDFLAGGVVLVAVLELAAQVAEAEHRLGTQVRQAGHARQRHLQRHRHLTLDLLGRAAGKLADDLDDGRRRVGIGLDVDVEKGVSAVAGQSQDNQHDHERIVQGPLDDLANHDVFSIGCSVPAPGIP